MIGDNVKEAVPFFLVRDMEASLHFYVDGLGFKMTKQWVYDDKVRWCLLRRDGVGVMLQDLRKDDGGSVSLEGQVGLGVSIMLVCDDALAIYREVTARGISASRPFVGNGMWVTSLRDPDGYRLDFESYTDVPEETEYSEADTST